MNAFVPTTSLSALCGSRVGSRSATERLHSKPATLKMSIAYPYTGSGYGAAGVPYGRAQPSTLTKMDIVQTAAAVPIFNTLVSLLQETGLDYELSKGGPFTVFAPTDGAFDALLDPHSFATLGSLLRPENRSELRNVLAYHVVKGEVSSGAAMAAGKIVGETLSGESLTVMGYNKLVSAGSAKVVKADVPCSNGVIHVVNSILLPSSYNTPPIRPEKPSYPTSQVLDIYKNTITPRQALGIDPLPAGAGALTK